MNDQQNNTDDITHTTGTKPQQMSRYTIAVICITAVHAVLLFLFSAPASTGVDTHGYTVQAKMIAEHGRVWYPLESGLQQYGDHWLRFEDNTLISRYPPGLPVLYAVVYLLFGSSSVFLVNPLLASLTLPGLFFLCRLWFRESLAFAAVLIMFMNPVSISWSFMADSHLLLAFCLVWGLYCIARWTESFSLIMAITGGFLLGWIPTIHYAEVVYAPAIAAYMLLHYKNTRSYWLSLTAAVISAVLPLFLLALHNQLVFGQILINGYTSRSNTALFSVLQMGKIFFYIANLHIRGLGWFATLGFIGFIALCQIKQTRREGVLLAGISITTLLMYSAYFFYDETMRFLLPTFYLYIIAGMWSFHLLLESKFNGAKAVMIAMISISVLVSAVSTVIQYTHIFGQNRALANAAKTVIETIPEPSPIIIAPKGLGLHLLFVSDYKIADDSFFLPDASNSGPMPPMEERPGSPPGDFMNGPGQLFEFDIKMKLMDYYKNDGTGLSANLLQDLDQWLGDQNIVYWIGEKDDILPNIPFRDTADVVGTIRFNPTLGLPHHNPQARRGRPNIDRLGRPLTGQPEQRDFMFQRPEGPPGREAPSGGRPGMGGGPRGPGRPPELRLIDMVIYKWTRTKENR